MKITLDIPDKDLNRYTWLLGLRYGKLKAPKTLLRMAIVEIVVDQANKVTRGILEDGSIPTADGDEHETETNP